MKVIGLSSPFSVRNNPITWLSSDSVQVVLQEVEMSSYLTNQVDVDVDQKSLGEIEI